MTFRDKLILLLSEYCSHEEIENILDELDNAGRDKPTFRFETFKAGFSINIEMNGFEEDPLAQENTDISVANKYIGSQADDLARASIKKALSEEKKKQLQTEDVFNGKH